MGVAVTRAAAASAEHATCLSEAYKALPGATYGGGEEAGGLLSKSPWQAGSLLPGTDQASKPSREGTIIAVVIRGEAPSIPQLGETRCVRSSAMLPSEGRGDRGSERSQLRGAQALPAV